MLKKVFTKIKQIANKFFEYLRKEAINSVTLNCWDRYKISEEDAQKLFKKIDEEFETDENGDI